ncbi:MAG TPA: hypothetical protein VHN99_06060, partial [Deinococcales bacterium]|nr:hypothetical protein [Deinococcales bacterium]
GLADALELDGRLVECAVEHAQRLAALPPDAWAATRRLVEPDAAGKLDAALEREAAEQGPLGRSEEHRKRLLAFTQRKA